MAVAGIGIERHVGGEPELGELALDRAERAADEIVRVQRLAAALVAQLGIGIGEQRERGNFQLHRPLGDAHDLVDAVALDAGHGGDRLAPLLALANEQRPDQIVHREHVLGHQPPRPFGLAVAARADREIETVRAARSATGFRCSTRALPVMGGILAS